MIQEIPCVIFAGGKSSRMGEDKALLPFGDFDTLTQFQLHKLSKIFKNVYISCKDKSKFRFEANFIEDIKTESLYAPTAGFLAIFETLHEQSFFAISVDTPFITKDIITEIVQTHNKNPHADAIIAESACGIHPLLGVYNSSLQGKFYKMMQKGNHKLKSLLKISNTYYVNIKNEEHLMNLNTQDEYKKALNILN